MTAVIEPADHVIQSASDPRLGGGVQAGIGQVLVHKGTSEVYVKTSSTAIGWDQAGGPSAALDIVELRKAPYSVTVNDETAGTANATAIRQALVDHPTNTLFLLPVGITYVTNIGNTGTYRFAAIDITGAGHYGLTIAGWGVGASALVMTGTQASGLSQIIQIADGPSKITLRDFSIYHSETVTNYDTVGLQNHQIELNAINADVIDVSIRNIFFGPCIGDAIRNAGGTATYLKNTHVNNVTMRLAGLSFLPLGCRSGISFQKGIQHYYLSDFYIHGPKNSPLDFEPTAASLIDNIHLSDGTLDNTGGQTIIAGSFTGYDNGAGTVSPVTNSSMSRVRVVQGQLQCVNTENCVFDSVSIYGSGLGPMASQLASDPMLYVYKENRNLHLRNVNIRRDVGSVAGQLVLVQHATSVRPQRITVEGGEWRAGTNAGTVATSGYFRVEGCDGLRVRGLRIRVDGTSTSSERGVIIRPNTTNHTTDVSLVDCHFQSETAKMGYGVQVAAYTKNVSQIQIIGCNFSDCTNGIQWDALTTGVCDPYPVVQGNDFTGCTAPWTAQNLAINAVFPVIHGNRNHVAGFAGAGTPEAVVTAVIGSTYCRTDGGAGTSHYFKESGVGNTGWVAK
jgi:hypothetical protein